MTCLDCPRFVKPGMVTIRGEAQSALQALLRGMSHVTDHTGQILRLVRLLRPDSAGMTIAPGQSRGIGGDDRQLSARGM